MHACYAEPEVLKAPCRTFGHVDITTVSGTCTAEQNAVGIICPHIMQATMHNIAMRWHRQHEC